MNVKGPEFCAGLILLLLGGGSLPIGAQGVPGRGRPIEFSDPRVQVVTSNLNSAAISRKGSLRVLDDQFKASFNLLDPSDPLGVPRLSTPLLRPPTLTPEAAKQLLEKKREDEQWIFGAPEEMEARRLSAERLFGVTEFDEDGREATSKSPLERYWERRDTENAGATNRLGSDSANQKTDQEIKEQASVMFGISNLQTDGSSETKGPVVRSVLAPAYTSPFAPDVSPLRGASDLFSAPTPAINLPKNDAATGRMNEFKQLIDTRPAGSGLAGGLGAPPTSAFTRPSSVSDYGTAPAVSWRSPSVPSASSFNSLPSSSFSRPPSATPVAGINPTPTPAVQPVRTVSPPANGFQLPKRTF